MRAHQPNTATPVVALRSSELRYRRLFESAKDGVLILDAKTGMVEDVNPFLVQLLGLTHEALLGKKVWELGFLKDIAANAAKFAELQAKDYVRYEDLPLETANGRKIEVEFVSNVYLMNQRRLIQCNIRDITARKRTERLAKDVLAALNRPNNTKNIIRDILEMIKTQTGIEAVGIRLKAGEEFPYYQTHGLPDDFVQLKNRLCARDAAGQLLRDGQGHPVLECMCGNVICRRTDAKLPYFTSGGSFWTNSATELLATITGAERLVRTLNRCHGTGYEAVAMIPLRAGAETIGLLQLLDHRRDQFTTELITVLEWLGDSVGVALTRMRLEDALRKSEARYRSLFECSREAIVTLELPSGMFTAGNPAALKIFAAKSEEELLALRPWDLSPERQPDGRASAEKAKEIIETAVREGSHFFEWMHRRRDGAEFPAEVLLTRMEQEGKVSLQATIRDITVRKQTEAALRANEAQYRSLFENSVMGVSQALPDGRLLHANQAYAEIYGYANPAEMMAAVTDVGALYANPDDCKEVLRILSEKGILEPREVAVVRRDGSSIIVLEAAREVRDTTGKLLCYQAEHVDITRRKRAEEALRTAQQITEEILNAIPVRVFWKDKKLVYLGCNKIFACDAGFADPKDIIGKDDFQTGWREQAEKYRADDRQVIESGCAKLLIEESQTTPAGDTITLLSSKLPLRNATGEIYGVLGVYLDITVRKQAEAARQKSEAEFRAMFEVASIGMAQADLHTGQWLRVNQKMCTITGFSADELLHKRIEELTHPEDRKKDWEAFQQVVRGETPDYRMEKRYLRKDGTVAWVNVNMTVIRDVAGQPIRTMAVIEDITTRREAVDALREQTRLLSESQRLGHIGSWLTNLTGPVTTWSEELYHIFGVSRDTFTPTRESLLSLIQPDDRPAMQNWLVACAAGEKPGELETRIIKPDGTTGYIRSYGNAYYDVKNKLIHIAGMAQDITERKQAIESQARLAMASEQAAETIVITDTDAKILYANPAFEKITGYTRAEALGQNPRILKSDKQDAEFYLKMWATLTAGQVWHGHFINKRKNGMLFEEEATISPVRDAAGKVTNYVAVKRDVTREVAQETQNRQTAKMEAIGQLAGGVAHDFNNKLQIILFCVEILLKNMPPEHPSRADLLDIQEAARRSADLTRQLLTFSRRQTITPVLLDLNAAISASLKMLSRLVGENIQLNFAVPHELGRVFLDPGQLDQLLANLVINARDAIAGTGKITIAATNRTLQETDCRDQPDFVTPGDYVVLTISDDGAGMTPEIQAHIFEPFFTTKGVGKGTGLGLATIYGIVKQNNGAIQVQSTPGRGTAFTIYLPRASDAAHVAEEAAVPQTLTGTETILVAEDEAGVLKLVQRTLLLQGYKVLTAVQPGLALQMCAQYPEPIHLLLTDVIMPDMSGKELATRIQKLRPNIQVIYMSGYTADIMEQHGQIPAGLHVLQKPFTDAALAQRVRAALDKSPPAHAGT